MKRTLGFVPTWCQTFAGAAVKRRTLLSGAFKAEFPDHDGARMFLNQLDVAGQLTGRDSLNQALYLWSKRMLPNYVLTILGDRMEMTHSIEGRVPFLDHHLIECLRQVPVSLEIRGTTEKHILREATRSGITDTVYRRQNHPFLSPPVTTLPGERFHEMLQDTLRGPFEHNGSCATLEDWFNPRRLREDDVPTGWKGPPGTKTRTVKGHEFGLDLSPEERRSLITFLRML